MNIKIVSLLLGLIFTSLITVSASNTSQVLQVDRSPEIIIDGNMTDWRYIANLVNDSKTDVPGMNLIGAQVVNNTEFLFIRMIYVGAYEYPLLWGNVTLRNSADDVFVLMAFVATDKTQEDTWVFPGTDINNPSNDPSQPDTYKQYPKYAAVSADYTSIEFKIPFADIDSGNPANLADIDLVFWHFDAFQASLSLSFATENDRAPDTGYSTYFPGIGPKVIGPPIEDNNDETSKTTSTTTSIISPSDTTAPVPISALWFAALILLPIIKKYR